LQSKALIALAGTAALLTATLAAMDPSVRRHFEQSHEAGIDPYYAEGPHDVDGSDELAASAPHEPAPHDMTTDTGADTVADTGTDRPAILADAEEATDVQADDVQTDEADARVETEQAPGASRRVVEVGRGDTLMELLADASVPRAEAAEAVDALRKVYNPRQLQVGQQIALLFEEAGGESRFVGLELEADAARAVSVSRDEEGFAASETVRAVTRQPFSASVEIRSSLYQAAVDAGIPAAIVVSAIRTLSHEVDFQRDLQPGDRFDVVFDRHVTEDGQIVRDGHPDMLRLVLSGKMQSWFRYEAADGTIDWYDRAGASIRKALLRTPVDGARLSSGFGMRRHPILGYSLMHKGVDFAAPTGTPVYAAGDGVVEEIGPKGAYGNYIRVKHGTQFATAYAHLSAFARGLGLGHKVKQGQLIGYVGSTGRSTGPHLHHEVLRNGQQVNPTSIQMPVGRTLQGRELAAFHRHVAEVEQRFKEAAARGMQLVGTRDAPVPRAPGACTGNAGC